jgi:hypothetical protein
MKKETTNQIIKKSINKKLMDIIFEKVGDIVFERVEDLKPLSYTDEEQMLLHSDKFLKVKVKSVALPKGFVFLYKTEEETLKWMTDKIHNVHSAFSQINCKYKEDAYQVSWNNNKMQNQRYLETTGKI